MTPEQVQAAQDQAIAALRLHDLDTPNLRRHLAVGRFPLGMDPADLWQVMVPMVRDAVIVERWVPHFGYVWTLGPGAPQEVELPEALRV